jgi:hypothetical protein
MGMGSPFDASIGKVNFNRKVIWRIILTLPLAPLATSITKAKRSHWGRAARDPDPARSEASHHL